jgi:signal peptidase I
MRSLLQKAQLIWPKIPCRNLLAAAVAALIGVAIGRHFLGTVCIVTGPSMEPTFAEGDHVLTTPVDGALARGQIVILEDGRQDYAIKRVIGLPGEKVALWRGYVYINERILVEPYIPRGIYTFPREKRSFFILGDDEYFVLGDNRPCSADSRMYGPVPFKSIKRKIPRPKETQARFGPMVLMPVAEKPVSGKDTRHAFASKM